MLLYQAIQVSARGSASIRRWMTALRRFVAADLLPG